MELIDSYIEPEEEEEVEEKDGKPLPKQQQQQQPAHHHGQRQHHRSKIRTMNHSMFMHVSFKNNIFYDIETDAKSRRNSLLHVQRRYTQPARKHKQNTASNDANDAGKNPLCVRFTAGKRIGVYPLPFGGQIRIPPEAMPKDGFLTCQIIPPYDRYKFEPIIRTEDDRLLSEVFVMRTNGTGFKRPIHLQLPHIPCTGTSCDVRLLHRPINGKIWQTIEDVSQVPTKDSVCFETLLEGAFLVISSPVGEKITVPPQGCLFTAKRCRQFTARFPKASTTSTIQVEVQIVPTNVDQLPTEHRCHIIGTTDIFGLIPVDPQTAFQKDITVRLPFPATTSYSETEGDANGKGNWKETIGVLQSTPDGWKLTNASVKLSRNFLTFNTRELSHYCVAFASPDKTPEMTKQLNTLLEKRNAKPREVIPSLELIPGSKSWVIWFDCVSSEAADETIEAIKKQGHRIIEPVGLLPRTGAGGKPGVVRRAPPPSKKNEVWLASGTYVELEISGDLEIVPEDEEEVDRKLYCHDRMPRNCRRFAVVPKANRQSSEVNVKGLTGILQVLRPAPEGAPGDRKCLRTYDFDIEPAVVNEYFYVQPDLMEEAEDTQLESSDSSSTTTSKPPRRPRDWAAVERLTKALRMNTNAIAKETRTLNGRSLRCLAKVLDGSAAIELGRQLNVCDSAIAAIAYDSVISSNTMIATDAAYRILLLWKRKGEHIEPNLQIESLIGGLREIGKGEIADIIQERYQSNMEIVADCFGHRPV